jgi:hypothetical protein
MTMRVTVSALLLAGAVLACSPRTERAAPSDSASVAPADTVRRPVAPDSTDPVRVLSRYYEAINRREYRSAYLLWGDSGRASGKSFEAFQAGYSDTDSVGVVIGEPGRVEGAAGSRFVEVPVTIRAWTGSGTEQHFAGSYVLRRTVVDGATDAQRQWHIYSAEIH